MSTFTCPEWTRTGGECCPRGTFQSDCPALKQALAARRADAAFLPDATTAEPLTGTRLEALSRPPWPMSARILLASLAGTLLFTLTGLLICHLRSAETAFQLAARV
ncbi:hypothetical protein PZ897_02215 [Hoeflea sp. YIM 152468]|uniref:hypothetical protein n=1 Tax=Hoeflea sp. YIM 152468 TaxID=3031759 RepID=UPI0023D9ADDD|nr:hypothetical protein [Hoeflea sp. YIM 152468]MDF1606985.1 hypothetical protein [Hoeflea sp. YIM 152468]